MRALLAATLALALSASASLGAYRITFDPGGVVSEFIAKYQLIQETGGRVVIDGPCISACTLVTALVDDDKVCVTKRAIMGFHSASLTLLGITRTHDSESTRLMWNMYPERVQQILLNKGWNGDDPKTNENTDLVYVKGAELRLIYPDCAP